MQVNAPRTELAEPAASVDRRLAQVAIALLAVGVLWRVVRWALAFPIWGDEAFVAVNFFARDYRGMFEPLLYGQIVPLVFMWVELAMSRMLGMSEWALRLVPLLCGIAALVLFARFARRLLPASAGLLALGIFAVAYYPVRHAAEVKPYASDLLVSLVLTMLAWSVTQHPRAFPRWLVFALAAAAAPWCSYPSLFVIGGAACVLTWTAWTQRSDPRVVAGWLTMALLAVGSSAAMIVLYAQPHAAAAARLTEIDMWTRAFPPLQKPWLLPVWLLAVHTGPMLAYPHGGQPPGSIITLVLVIVGAWRLWRDRRPLAVLLLAPLAFTFAGACLHKYPYGGSARTSLYLAPALCLLAGLGLDGLLRRFVPPAAQRNAWLIALAGLLVFGLGGMVADLVKPYKSQPVLRSREAVATIAGQTSPGDRWIVFNADRPVDYAPYLGDWMGVGGQFVFDVLRFAPAPPEWAPQPASVELPPGGRLWLLTYYVEHRKVQFPTDKWEAYRAMLTQRLGPPVHESYSVKNEPGKVERIEVYRFGP